MTAKQDFEDFLKQQEVIGYSLGDITGTPEGDMQRYTELKIALKQESAKIKAFNEARDAAFKELNKKHDAEKIALGKVWQEKEDNGYQI